MSRIDKRINRETIGLNLASIAAIEARSGNIQAALTNIEAAIKISIFKGATEKIVLYHLKLLRSLLIQFSAAMMRG